MDPIDINTLTIANAIALQQGLVTDFANLYANAAAIMDQYSSVWIGGLPQPLATITQTVPGCLDQLCQSLGMGSYLQVVGQVPAQSQNPMPSVSAMSLGLIPPSQ